MTAVTLSDGLTTLTLAPDLEWQDEMSWYPPEQSVTRTLTGALIVQSASKQYGRPITLAAGDTHAWMPRSDFNTLASWAATPGQVLTLTLRGQTHSVVFRHHEPPAIEGRDLVPWGISETPNAGDWCILTIRLMTVEP